MDGLDDGTNTQVQLISRYRFLWAIPQGPQAYRQGCWPRTTPCRASLGSRRRWHLPGRARYRSHRSRSSLSAVQVVPPGRHAPPVRSCAPKPWRRGFWASFFSGACRLELRLITRHPRADPRRLTGFKSGLHHCPGYYLQQSFAISSSLVPGRRCLELLKIASCSRRRAANALPGTWWGAPGEFYPGMPRRRAGTKGLGVGSGGGYPETVVSTARGIPRWKSAVRFSCPR